MGDKERQIPANVGMSLTHLHEVQGIVEPRGVGLFQHSLRLFEAEGNNALPKDFEGVRLTDASTTVDYEGMTYTVRAFAQRGQADVFEKRGIEAGLRLFSPDHKATGLYTDLTFYESGVARVGITDSEDTEALDATFAFAKSLMQELEKVIEKTKEEKAESAQAAYEAKEEAKARRARNRRERFRSFRRAGALGCVALVSTGAAYGLLTEQFGDTSQITQKIGEGFDRVANVFRGRANRFDAHNYRLSGGNTGGVNEIVVPAFSQGLYNDTRLSATELPRVNHKVDDDNNLGESTYPYDDDLAIADGLREIIITSSKDGKNCQTAKVDHITIGSRIVAWTDFVGTGNNSRADELTIRLRPRTPESTSPIVEACWNGRENNDNDDPRIVFDLR